MKKSKGVFLIIFYLYEIKKKKLGLFEKAFVNLFDN